MDLRRDGPVGLSEQWRLNISYRLVIV